MRGDISDIYENLSDQQLWSLLEGEQENGSGGLREVSCKTPLQCFAQNPESQSSACSIKSIRSNVTLRKGKKKQWARLKGGTTSPEPYSPFMGCVDLSAADTSTRDLRASSLDQGLK